MSARSMMTMRATVSRNLVTNDTGYGTPAKPSFVEIGVVPCFAWSKERRDKDDSSKSVVIEDIRAWVTKAADVQEEDQLVIRDRLGVLRFDGPVRVETRRPRSGSGSRASHYELMLTRHL